MNLAMPDGELDQMWARGLAVPQGKNGAKGGGFDAAAQAEFDNMMGAQKKEGWVKRKEEVDVSLRKMKSILNKITLDNYYRLSAELIEQGGDFSSAKFLETLVEELWSKAVTQHHFLAMYTQLAKDLR